MELLILIVIFIMFFTRRKARKRESRRVEAIYKRELREWQQEQLALEKQQLARLKGEFERRFENSKNLLAKREAKRKNTIKTYIKKNFK